jgi:AcrR family transcriptional regulator
VTMARVAERLGYTPMSLYRYVGSKDELIQLMFDEMGRDLGVSVEGTGGWREGLESLATALADRYAQHPWAVDVPIAGVPTMPSQVAVMEYGLELLIPEGLDPGEALGVLQLVAGFVRSQAALFRDIARAATPGAVLSPFAAAATVLADLIDPDEMPRVAEVARSGLLSPPPSMAPDSIAALDDLRFGLDRILDGVEVFIARRRASEL